MCWEVWGECLTGGEVMWVGDLFRYKRGMCSVLKWVRANTRCEGKYFNREGLLLPLTPFRGYKEWVTWIYLSDSLVSASPGLLHDLWDAGAGPSVSPLATSLHGWQVGDQAGAQCMMWASSVVPSAGSGEVSLCTVSSSLGQLGVFWCTLALRGL